MMLQLAIRSIENLWYNKVYINYRTPRIFISYVPCRLFRPQNLKLNIFNASFYVYTPITVRNIYYRLFIYLFWLITETKLQRGILRVQSFPNIVFNSYFSLKPPLLLLMLRFPKEIIIYLQFHLQHPLRLCRTEITL